MNVRQSWIKLLKAFLPIYKFHHNIDASTTQYPLPPHQCWSAAEEKRLGDRPSFKATLSEGEVWGGGGVNVCYSPGGVKGD